MSQDAKSNQKLILRRLQRGKAILLLGPEVLMASRKESQPLKEALQDFIKEDLDGVVDDEDLEKIEYYSEDGFFSLEDDYRLEVVESVLQFYENQTVSDLYTKLGAIALSSHSFPFSR